MPVIDADAHVVETERTWEYVEKERQELLPQVVVPKKGGGREFWAIEGRIFPKNANLGKDTPDGAPEMSDVAARIAHMDELGMDIHVLYPSIFLRPLTRHSEVELALSQSYNRWLADIWRMGKGRLRWVAVLPWMSMPDAVQELHWAKERGACGVFMRNAEGYHRPSDPYFFPLYEEASKLDMPICFHSSQGTFEAWDLYLRDGGFSQFKLTIVGAFHDLLMKGIPAKFPELRWSFVEVTSQWIPYALNDMELRFRRLGRKWEGPETLRENRIFVACQTTDDLVSVLQNAGEDNIVIGTDYGHNDTASELLALRRLRADGKISPHVADKILGDNPTRLYGL
jgi:predicted TIM-barrel fold metal-dependent hydrolase